MLSFKLEESFVNEYKDKEVAFGFKNEYSGVSLGELTFLSRYSRVKEDGSKERWYEVVRRVVEGCYSIQKDHCNSIGIEWSESKALRSAQEMYDLIFNFKFTPSGRGLWAMGTSLIHEHKMNAALWNCAFTSTNYIDQNPTEPFCYLMDLSMLGVGVGFDTKGAGKVTVDAPERYGIEDYVYRIPDSREGWVTSVRLLLEAYIYCDNVEFDYSGIRPYGAPIKTFGGTAPGPEPLIHLHNELRKLLNGRTGKQLDSRDIVDIMNLIGVCVVSGNVRRSAEIALGRPDDPDFVHLKEYDRPENEYRSVYGWMSNNSIVIEDGDNIEYERVADAIIRSNGEPGIFWLDNSRKYGRAGEERPDSRVEGTNPCGEISLEHMELCNVVETYPSLHDDIDEYNRTLKYAYLYGKSLTLLNTHWKKTNAVMLRNRRIGISMSGVADFADKHGPLVLHKLQREGYDTIQKYDNIYSEWLCIRNSIKTTTVKPSGTVSLLAGVSAGVHWPVDTLYIRREIFSANDPVLPVLEAAGYTIKPSSFTPNSVFAELPTRTDAERNDSEVSLSEKFGLVAATQNNWSDNAVSVSIYFDAERDRDQLAALLESCEAEGMKSISCFPQQPTLHPERPYESITYAQYQEMSGKLLPVTFDAVYDGVNTKDVAGDVFCTTESCVI